MLWLRIYTNHGQKLELPDYRNMSVEEARIDAQKKSFELIVNDSLFRVGTPGGIILNQNPEAGSKVKENRKVYFTYAYGSKLANRTRVATAVYKENALTDWKVIFDTFPCSTPVLACGSSFHTILLIQISARHDIR